MNAPIEWNAPIALLIALLSHANTREARGGVTNVLGRRGEKVWTMKSIDHEISLSVYQKHRELILCHNEFQVTCEYHGTRLAIVLCNG